MRAQQREMPEPYEGSRPIPWIVILIVAGVFLWAIGYIWFPYRDAAAALGDHRINADFALATAQTGGAIDGGQGFTAHCLACQQATGPGLGMEGHMPDNQALKRMHSRDSCVNTKTSS